MNEVKGPVEVNIGHRHLKLCLAGNTAALHGMLAERFKGYLAPALQGAVRLNVTTWWAAGRIYRWPANAIYDLTACIKAALQRLPQTHPIESRLAAAIGILRRTDPQDAALQRLNFGNGDAQSLVFAMSGENIFLYQPPTRTAAILLKRTVRRAHMLAGIMNAIMFTLSYLLIQDGGLLLHGCALERNRKTALFLGRSGSGKTTSARLCRPDVCFADDGVVIVEAGGRFMVHSSPFRQIDSAGEVNVGHTATVEKIILLEKSACEQIAPIDKHLMMLFILRHAIHFFKYLDDDTVRKGFETVKRLLDMLPIYRLQFRRDSDIWKLVFP